MFGRCRVLHSWRTAYSWFRSISCLRVRQQCHLLLRQPRFVFVVRANDSLDEMMPYHITFIEVDKSQPVHPLQDIDRLEQSAPTRTREVDLRYISSDHRF